VQTTLDMSHLVFETRDEACYGLKGMWKRTYVSGAEHPSTLCAVFKWRFVAKEQDENGEPGRHCAAVKCLIRFGEIKKNAKRQ